MHTFDSKQMQRAQLARDLGDATMHNEKQKKEQYALQVQTINLRTNRFNFGLHAFHAVHIRSLMH